MAINGAIGSVAIVQYEPCDHPFWPKIDEFYKNAVDKKPQG